MRTNILLMCFLQLQIIWVNPTLTFSSTDESPDDLRTTYPELLGKRVARYTDGCVIFSLWTNVNYYFNAVSYCMQKGIRLPIHEVTQEMTALKPILNSLPKDAKIWVLAKKPDSADYCPYAYLEGQNVKYQIVECYKVPDQYYVVTVNDTKKEGKPCKPIDIKL